MIRHRAVLLAALLLAPATASAIGVDPGQATPVQREQAQTRFLKGKQKYDAGDYKTALDEFLASLEIVQSPNTRLYVARSYREMGKLVDAYVEFGRTMVEAKEHAAADGRYAKAAEAAQNERNAVAPYLGFVTLTVTNPTEDAKLSVNGAEVKRAGWTEPIPVMPGSGEVRLESSGHDTVVKPLNISAGQQVAVTIETGADVVAPNAPPPPVKADPPTKPLITGLRIGAIAAGGVGVVGLVMFGVAGVSSINTYNALEKQCGKNMPCPGELQGNVNRGKSEQAIANVGLIMGIAGLAVGGGLFAASIVLSKPSKTETQPAAAVSFGPGSVTLSGTF
jgi:hypothetical protein